MISKGIWFQFFILHTQTYQVTSFSFASQITSVSLATLKKINNQIIKSGRNQRGKDNFTWLQ